MKILLTTFEENIDPTILSRGKSYYRKGAVVVLDELGNGDWQAIVSGHDEYTVDVSVRQDIVTSFNCTCPYDFGAFCKHEVAVFYSIRDGVKIVKTRKTKKISPPSFPNKDTKINNIIQSLSQVQLVDFIIELSEQSLDIQRQILLRFSQEVPDKKSIIQKIKNALNQAADRHGYLDYWSAGRAAKNVWMLLEEAEQLIQQKRFNTAIPYYQGVIEVVVPALQQADDSNGEFGVLIETSFERVIELIPFLAQIEKEVLFSYSLQESLSSIYEGWSGWQLQWVRIAAHLIKTSSDQSELFKTLDELMIANKRATRVELLDDRLKIIPNPSGFDVFDSYFLQKIILIKYQVITKHQGENAGLQFLLNHQDLPDIKEELVKYYTTVQSFDKAKQLAEQGYVQYLKSLPGLAINFAQLLVIIAQRQKDNDSLIKWASISFLGWGNFDYYDLMKQTLNSKMWTIVVENLLKETGENSQHPHAGIYVKAKILAQEHRISELYDFIISCPQGYGLLLEYESMLKTDYPEGVAKIYEEEIYKKLQNYDTNRAVYQEICRLLRKIKKLGFSKKADEISNKLRVTYPKKPALLDELSRV